MSDKLEKTVFIVGNSRSGTTMLGRILDNHSAIHMFKELHFFDGIAPASKFTFTEKISYEKAAMTLRRLFRHERDGLYAKDDNKYLKDSEAVLKNMQSISYPVLFSSFINYETRLNGKSIACKQTPYYLSYIPEISLNMENVYFIYLVRDPRAVALSQKNRWRRNKLSNAKNPVFKEVLRSWANYHPFITSKIWVNCERKANSYAERENFRKVSYEQLVNDPKNIIQDLCRWLDIKFEPNMIEIPFIGSSVKTDQTHKTGTDKSRINAWKDSNGLTSTEISIIQKVARAEMDELGYEIEPVKISVFEFIYSSLLLFVKSILSIALNIYRSGNPFILLKRRLNL